MWSLTALTVCWPSSVSGSRRCSPPWLCGLALRHLPDLRLHRQGVRVSTLEILLGGAALSTLFASRAAISFLVFTLLYTPCIAAVATIRREFNSTLKTVGVVLMQCCVAWIVAFVVYTLVGIL